MACSASFIKACILRLVSSIIQTHQNN
uniref:Uncharacterized protein n=1 Tax=Anguilla anguilla TaxID=7936 RepID=A0A0E9SU55_ANGAN